MRGAFDESLSLEALERIDARCQAFEHAWMRGEEPSIAEALGAAAGAERECLLRELVLLDVEYRRRRGESPSVEECARRLPADSALVEAALRGQRRVGRSLPAPPPMSGPSCAGAGAGGERVGERRKLGEYTILREVGRGGMGLVYEAVQESLGRRVALKVLQFDAGTEPGRLERFHLESRAAAALQHQHIVAVYGTGSHEGQHYFAMQFIEGRGLDSVIEERRAARGRSPDGRAPGSSAARKARDKGAYREVARIVHQAAGALAYAHGRGVLHRDVKPSNLLLDAKGDVWVTDFGLAKAVGSEGLTRSGEILGTLRYMAPERLQGWSDPRSDIYALGLTLYELLALEPAFDDADRGRLVRRIAEDDPRPLDQVEPGVPEELRTIVGKATEKESSRRYASMAEMSEDLRRFLEDEPILARPPSTWERAVKWSRRHRAAVKAGAAVLTLTAVGLAISTVLVSREQGKTRLALDDSRRNLYAAHMNLAEQALEDGNSPLVLDLLEQEKPAPGEKDLRGFEWYLLRRRCQGGLAALRAHEGGVNAVAFSSDGRTLATGGDDGTARLWDVEAQRELKVLRGHSKRVTGIAHLDGDRLATGSEDGTVKLWDIPRGTEAATLGKPGSAPLYDLASTKGGDFLAAACDDHTVRLWEVATRSMTSLTGHEFPVVCVTFRPDGEVLASGSHDGTVRFWSVRERREVATLDVSLDWVLRLSFSPDGNTLAAPNWAERLVVWDLGNWPWRFRQRPYDLVRGVGFYRDGWHLVTGGEDFTVRALDLELSEESVVSRGHRGAIRSLSIHPGGALVATASADGTVGLCGLGEGGEDERRPGHGRAITSLAVSPDGKLVASCSWDGTAKLWDLHSGRELRTADESGDLKNCVAFSPDGRRLAVGGGDVALHDAETLDLIRRESVGASIRRLSFLGDGASVVAWLNDGNLVRWDIAGGKKSLLAREDLEDYSPFLVLPDGHTIVLGTMRGALRFVDGATGAGRTLADGDAQVACLRVTGGGALIEGCADGTVKLWNLEMGRVVRRFAGHRLAVNAVAASPDERRLATASLDRSVKLWDFETAEVLLTLRPRPGGATALAFSPDGDDLIAGASDGSLWFWSRREREPSVLEAHLERALAAPADACPGPRAAPLPIPAERGRTAIVDLGRAVLSVGVRASLKEATDGLTRSAVGGPPGDRREGRLAARAEDRYIYLRVIDDRLRTARRLAITCACYDDPAFASDPAALQLEYTTCHSASLTRHPDEQALSGSGEWVERTWHVDDAGFRGRIDDAHDFRIGRRGPPVVIDWVRVSSEEPEGGDEPLTEGERDLVIAEPGTGECPNGLALVPWADAEGDPASAGPPGDTRKVLTTHGNGYMYFLVDEAAVKGSECLAIRAVLYDDPTFRDSPVEIGLQYTSVEATSRDDVPRTFLPHPDRLFCRGSGAWVEAKWEVADAGFRSLQQDVADFRLALKGPPVSVERVEVRALEPCRIHAIVEAERLEREGRIEEAEASLRRELARLAAAVQGSPGDAGPQFDGAFAELLLAEGLAERGSTEEAERALDHAVQVLQAARNEFGGEREPYYLRVRPDVSAWRAWELVKAPGAPAWEVPKAIFLAGEALRLRPGDGWFLRALGAAHLRAGHPEQAVEILERAQGRLLDEPQISFLLAVARRETGDEAGAQEAFERAEAQLREHPTTDRELLAIEREAADALGAGGLAR